MTLYVISLVYVGIALLFARDAYRKLATGEPYEPILALIVGLFWLPIWVWAIGMAVESTVRKRG